MHNHYKAILTLKPDAVHAHAQQGRGGDTHAHPAEGGQAQAVAEGDHTHQSHSHPAAGNDEPTQATHSELNALSPLTAPDHDKPEKNILSAPDDEQKDKTEKNMLSAPDDKQKDKTERNMMSAPDGRREGTIPGLLFVLHWLYPTEENMLLILHNRGSRQCH